MEKQNRHTKRIAIQDIKGAFHEIAARSYFSAPIDICPAVTFEELVTYTEEGQLVDAGIMAIENSIAGSLMNNYHLLSKSKLKITGEIFLRIRHQLLVLPGESLADIREVYSHPMAIAQCKSFFQKHPKIRLIESADTAMSAQSLSMKKIKGQAAIASRLAAMNFDLEIAAENIETNKENYTRFLILESGIDSLINDDFEKVSIAIKAKHEVGSLNKILGVLEDQDANMTKIQSTPILGQPWQYCFFIDFTIDAPNTLSVLLEKLHHHSLEVQLLGTYKKGIYYES